MREDNAKNGTGSASGVAWNSNIWDIPGEGRRPPYIGLAHELIHAWHNAYGIMKHVYADEEDFTVGLTSHAAGPDGRTGDHHREHDPSRARHSDPSQILRRRGTNPPKGIPLIRCKGSSPLGRAGRLARSPGGQPANDTAHPRLSRHCRPRRPARRALEGCQFATGLVQQKSRVFSKLCFWRVIDECATEELALKSKPSLEFADIQRSCATIMAALLSLTQ